MADLRLTEREQLKLLDRVFKGEFPDLETALRHVREARAAVARARDGEGGLEGEEGRSGEAKARRGRGGSAAAASKKPRRSSEGEAAFPTPPPTSTTTTTTTTKAAEPPAPFTPPPVTDEDVARAHRLRLGPLPPGVGFGVGVNNAAPAESESGSEPTPAQRGEPTEPREPPHLAPNSLVQVLPRPFQPHCRFREGGVAHVVRFDAASDSYEVRYTLGGSERGVKRTDLVPQSLATVGMGGLSRCCALLGEAAADGASSSTATATATATAPGPNAETLAAIAAAADEDTSAWVRRSTRLAGSDQLSRPPVRDLLDRLARDEPELKILRLKNWLQADTNTVVFEAVLELLRTSKVVQALYCQALEAAVDDKRLAMLTAVLRANQRIWALNVGENFRVTRRGWEAFARALPETGVTHLYAGSESTVVGELKERMRFAVRANRAKHDLHDSKDNLDVIMRIGQMWWCPRNAAKVRAHLAEVRGSHALGLDEGAFVAVKLARRAVAVDADVDADAQGGAGAGAGAGAGEDEAEFRIARVVKPCPAPGAPPNLFLVFLLDSEEVMWLDLDDSKLAAAWTSKVVWASSSGGGGGAEEAAAEASQPSAAAEWPALHFPDADLLAWTFGAPPASFFGSSANGNGNANANANGSGAVWAPDTVRVSRSFLVGDAEDRELVPPGSSALLVEVARRAAREARRMAQRVQ